MKLTEIANQFGSEAYEKKILCAAHDKSFLKFLQNAGTSQPSSLNIILLKAYNKGYLNKQLKQI